MEVGQGEKPAPKTYLFWEDEYYAGDAFSYGSVTDGDLLEPLPTVLSLYVALELKLRDFERRHLNHMKRIAAPVSKDVIALRRELRTHRSDVVALRRDEYPDRSWHLLVTAGAVNKEHRHTSIPEVVSLLFAEGFDSRRIALRELVDLYCLLVDLATVAGIRAQQRHDRFARDIREARETAQRRIVAGGPDSGEVSLRDGQ